MPIRAVLVISGPEIICYTKLNFGTAEQYTTELGVRSRKITKNYNISNIIYNRMWMWLLYSINIEYVYCVMHNLPTERIKSTDARPKNTHTQQLVYNVVVIR